MNNFFEKAVLAIPLGAFVGLWIEIVLLRGALDDYHPMKGTLIGISLAAVLSLVFQKVKLQAIVKRAAVGGIIGLVFALFIGAFVFPSQKLTATLEQMVIENPAQYEFVSHSTMGNAYHARYQYEGLLSGLPFGVLAGALLGIAYHVAAKLLRG